MLVARDGDEFTFRLTRLAPPRKSARATALGIKAER